jgi:hypothetical protein
VGASLIQTREALVMAMVAKASVVVEPILAEGSVVSHLEADRTVAGSAPMQALTRQERAILALA